MTKHKKLIEMLENVGHYCWLSREAQKVKARETSLGALEGAKINMNRAYLYLHYHYLHTQTNWQDVYGFQDTMYHHTRQEHLHKFKKNYTHDR